MTTPTLIDLMGETSVFLFFTNVPWLGLVDSNMLDADYLFNHSGAKLASPLPRKMASANEDNLLTDEQKQKLAQLIQAKFADPWTHLWDAFTAEYNPIHNYNMVEEKTGEYDGHKDINGSVGDTTTTDHGMSEEQESLVQGFNSTTYQPSEKDVITDSGQTKVTTDGTNESHDEHTDSEHYILTRKGNIGVTTTQKMIREDFDLWRSYSFFESIYHDIDTVLTLSIYDTCRV